MMTPVAISLTSGAFLTVLLFLVWRTSRVPSQFSNAAFFDEQDWAACPAEFVSEIFAPEDSEFIDSLNSPLLKDFFVKERASVARAWIHHTSASIRHIMREHLQLSRRSPDLEIGTEFQIYATYILLQSACIALLLSLEFAGPARLRAVSLQFHRLAERFSSAHGQLQAAFDAKVLHGASQS
jgi:hypothetical protein